MYIYMYMFIYIHSHIYAYEYIHEYICVDQIAYSDSLCFAGAHRNLTICVTNQ